MKKLLFLVALASILPFQGFSQFKLTINGFVSDKDETKNYVVLEADGVDKEALYVNVLKYLTSIYKSAQDAISKVDNEVITIHDT